MDDMTALAQSLAEKGFAYEKLRSLYFNISKIPDYGKLSGIDIDKIRLGATVDLDEYEKENPRDFTLLKRAKLSELKGGLYVKSQWGSVRPSWHLQCAAISRKYLGEHIDIHTSSRDHIFPHHENEIAISTALTGRPSARYWIHCDQVLIDAEQGNVKASGLKLEDLSDMGLADREIRLWMLSTHYRKPVTLSKDRLISVQRSLRRMDACLRSLQAVNAGQPYPEIDQLLYDIRQDFTSAMDDDLNISAAMAGIFKKIKQINVLIEGKRIAAADASKIVGIFRKLDAVLNIFDFGQATVDSAIEQLLNRREQARKAKDWALADRLRDQLQSRGFIVRDRKIQTG
jgi:cysteinyl-tRNA synthetase